MSPNPRQDRPQLAFCADAAVAMALTVTVRSVVRRTSCGIDFHIVADGFSEKQKDAVRRALGEGTPHGLHWLDVGPWRSRLRSAGAWVVPYDRFLLVEALPQLDHVLYFDADLLVRCEVRELWARLLKTACPMLACADYYPEVTKDLLPMHEAEGIRLGAPYFNAGVLGLNLGLWRREGTLEDLLAFVRRHGGRIPYHDQGVLNARLGKRTELLPIQYNRPAWLATEDARIVHYCTFRKPFVRARRLFDRQDWALARWQHLSWSGFHFREYFETLDQTAYRGWRPTSLPLLLLRTLPPRWLEWWRIFSWRGRAASEASVVRTT